MHRTIFTTPLSAISSLCLHGVLKTGWMESCWLLPIAIKLIAAPRTSNWDLPYTLMVFCAPQRWLDRQIFIFRPPFLRRDDQHGRVSVDREKSNNLVAGSSAALTNAEGALRQWYRQNFACNAAVENWFYYIAAGAGVPIVLAYLDYEKKVGSLGLVFQTTGDIADKFAIKAYKVVR
jgi:hypothetical protein